MKSTPTPVIEVECDDNRSASTCRASADAIFIVDVMSGPSPASHVVLTDHLPTANGVPLNWVIDPPVSGCAIAGGQLTCDFGSLPAGATREVILRADVRDVICTVGGPTPCVCPGSNHSNSTECQFTFENMATVRIDTDTVPRNSTCRQSVTVNVHRKGKGSWFD